MTRCRRWVSCVGLALCLALSATSGTTLPRVHAAPEIPPSLPAQLKPGGRLCLPLGEPHGQQALMLYTKREDGTLVATGLGPVRFVPVQRGKPGREPPRQP